MRLTLLIFLFVISSTAQINTDLEATNNILRSWIPWWPKTEDLLTRSAPLENSTDIVDDQNSTSIDSNPSESLINDITGSDGSDLHLDPIPISPLDVLKSPKNTAVKSFNDGANFLGNFEDLAECPKNCSSDLNDALSMFLKDMSHIERYHRICKVYQAAYDCVNIDKSCDEEERTMFEVMTSGLSYMCIEQQLAFNATIKCIDDEAGMVQSECETQCQTKNLFMNWIMRSAMQNTIQQGVNGIVGAATGTQSNPFAFLTPEGQAAWLGAAAGKPISAETAENGMNNFKQFTNDLCRIGDCMLDCIRSKFNTRCEGSAGTLLSETIVRPIAAGQNKLTMLRPVLGIFMPEQCSYVFNNQDLKKHRIDATMDSELKRMYSEKMAKEINERAAQDKMLAEMVPLDENGVPLPNGDFSKDGETMLDLLNTKSLDERILELYSKLGNETETKKIEGKQKSETKISGLEARSGSEEASDLEGSGLESESKLEGSGIEEASGSESSGSEILDQEGSAIEESSGIEGSGVEESGLEGSGLERSAVEEASGSEGSGLEAGSGLEGSGIEERAGPGASGSESSGLEVSDQEGSGLEKSAAEEASGSEGSGLGFVEEPGLEESILGGSGLEGSGLESRSGPEGSGLVEASGIEEGSAIE